MFRKIFTVFYWLLMLVLVFFGANYFFSNPNRPAPLSFYAVLSGSMQPRIPAGAIVIVSRQPTYQKNDIITFRDEANPNLTVTHRIVEANNQLKTDNSTYKTKGDANKTADSQPVTYANVIGKVIFHLPYLGYLVMFSKTQAGFIALIVVPITLIVYTELVNIKNELAKIIKNRHEKTNS